MNKGMTISLKIIIMSCLIAHFISAHSEVEKLSQPLKDIVHNTDLDNVLFSNLTLQERNNSKKTVTISSYKKNMITVTIDDKIHPQYNFELYSMNDHGTSQKEILQALHNILTCSIDYEGIDAYYRQYNNAVIKNGHYSVFLWWSAFNVRTENGLTILDLPTNSWYNGGKTELQRMKYVLDIAMNEGKKDITFKELLNTLESFYSVDDDYRNFVIKEMIIERNHLNS